MCWTEWCKGLVEAKQCMPGLRTSEKTDTHFLPATASHNNYAMRLCSGGGSPRLEAFPAKHGASLGRAERNGSLLAASRASSLRLYLGKAIILSRCGRCTQHRDALGFASLAAFGFVLELLIVEEKLFPGRENKVSPTVNTLQHLVLKFH